VRAVASEFDNNATPHARGTAQGSLLTDPLIRADLSDGTRAVLTLPGLFVALGEDRVLALPALRPHQRHPWHAFTVQTATLALRASEDGGADWPADEAAWAAALRALTPDHPGDEPWSLVVGDLARPAFMQPPVPEGTLAEFKNTDPTPDALDMLVTAKNHDLKVEAMSDAGADDWLFALVSLQTMQGYSGRDPPTQFHWGVSRMNGGSANRPGLGLAPQGGPGAHWRRDVSRLREALWAHQEAPRPEWDGYDIPRGLGLVWLAPWDGVSQFARGSLHPLYIEVCRRLRFVVSARSALAVRRASSKVQRIAASEGGATGDPWTPLSTADGKALTVSADGFHYRRVSDLLLGSAWRLPLLAEAGPGEHGPFDLVCRALTRGQGKTEGYHERHVPIPARVARRLFGGDRASLEQLARERIDIVAALQKALAFAGRVLVQAGPEKMSNDAARNAFAAALAPRLAVHVDATFFDDLWAEVNDGSETSEVRHAWMRGLKRYAAALLTEAGQALPVPVQRRPRALVKAQGAFEGQLRKAKPWEAFHEIERERRAHRMAERESAA